MQTRDIGRGLSWDALSALIHRSPTDSALMRDINPDTWEWSQTMKTNTILADIYDELAVINANLLAMASGKPARRVKPYPRPTKKTPENEQHFGSGAMELSELEKWMEEKRREHDARSSTGNDHSNPGTGGSPAEPD